MGDATIDLRHALFTALSADTELVAQLGGPKVFDKVPERVSPPYVVVGRSASSDWSTATEDGEAIVFFVHTWSKSANRNESHDLQAHVKRIMAANLPALDDHHLVNLCFQLAETRRDRAEGYLHGVLRFRAVTEPRAQ